MTEFAALTGIADATGIANAFVMKPLLEAISRNQFCCKIYNIYIYMNRILSQYILMYVLFEHCHYEVDYIKLDWHSELFQ